MTGSDAGRPRRRRRAVGPVGAAPAEDPRLDLPQDPADEEPDGDREGRADSWAEHYLGERPPHHDRGV